MVSVSRASVLWSWVNSLTLASWYTIHMIIVMHHLALRWTTVYKYPSCLYVEGAVMRLTDSLKLSDVMVVTSI